MLSFVLIEQPIRRRRPAQARDANPWPRPPAAAAVLAAAWVASGVQSRTADAKRRGSRDRSPKSSRQS